MTPALADSSRPHNPAAIMTFSHSIVPRSVSTPVTFRLLGKPGDLSVLKDSDPTHAGALGHGHRDVDRVGAPFVGREKPSEYVVRANHRDEVGNLGLGQDVLVESVGTQEGGLAPESLLAASSSGQLQIAALLKPVDRPVSCSIVS